MAEMQWELNYQPCRVSTVKVRDLIGEEWDSVNWNGILWEDSDQALDIESINSPTSVLTVEAVLDPILIGEG